MSVCRLVPESHACVRETLIKAHPRSGERENIVLAQYTANVMNAPIGISEYQLNNLLKDEFKGKLPTIEKIERELRN